MLTDEQILEIGSKQGGYMKLPDDESKNRYRELKNTNKPQAKQSTDKAQEPQLQADEPIGKEPQSLSPEMQKLIAEAVAKQTQDLKEQNVKLKEEALLSQDEWRTLTPVKPENKICFLRKWRKTTDDEWRLVINMKHIKYDWDEETRRYDRDIYRLTLINYKGEDKNKITEEDIIYESLKESNDRAEFEIIEENIVQQAMSQGKIRRTVTTLEPDGKSKLYWSPGINDPNILGRTGDVVDMMVTRDSGTYTLKCLEPGAEGFTLKDFPIEKINN